MAKLGILNKDVLSIYHKVKLDLAYLSKLKGKRELPYLDKMMYSVYLVSLPFLEDIISNSSFSYVNLLRMKMILTGLSLVNLNRNIEFTRYNIPLFESSYDLINYRFYHNYRLNKIDKPKLNLSYKIAQKNFQIMAKLDKLHTKYSSLTDLINANIPILLGRNLLDTIKVELGYQYKLIYENIDSFLNLIDYSNLDSKYFYVYQTMIVNLLITASRQFKLDNQLTRTHKVKKDYSKYLNYLSNIESVYNKLLIKISTKYKGSFLEGYFNQYLGLKKSIEIDLNYQNEIDLYLIYKLNLEMIVNLSSLIDFNLSLIKFPDQDIISAYKKETSLVKTNPNIYKYSFNELLDVCLKNHLNFNFKNYLNLSNKQYIIFNYQKADVVSNLNGYMFYAEKNFYQFDFLNFDILDRINLDLIKSINQRIEGINLQNEIDELDNLIKMQ